MDDIRYVTTQLVDEYLEHKFVCFADADRPVMDIYVQDKVNEQQLPILIAAAGAPRESAQPTKGFTHTQVEYTVENGVDGVTATPCLNCIIKYIVPRTATMMARVYVPKSANV